MELYLASETSLRFLPIKENRVITKYVQSDRLHNDPQRINILNSFYYCRNNKLYYEHQNSNEFNILIDSGAFTFMQDSKYRVDWEKYTDEYCDWIKANGIKNFVEMDIDWVDGVENALKLRKRIENRTSMQPLPCWHTCRGKQAWIDICKDYDYAALSLGGATKTTEWFKKYNYAQLDWFLEVAQKYGCKIHGLGLTSKTVLKKHRFKFHSVDSTAWLAGNLGGFIYVFDESNGEMKKIKAPSGMRIKSQPVHKHNLEEWIRYQKWCRKYM